jgi:SSS family solute:Na+ symporter
MTSPGNLALSGADLFLRAAFVLAALYLGLRAARERPEGMEDYVLAGRALSLPGFIATLVPSFFGGTLGIGEYTWRYGVSNWFVQGLPYYIFALLYAVWLVPRVRARGGLTIPDHLEAAYGRKAAALGALLVFLLASPADEALMLGVLARWATGWPLAACVALVALVSGAVLWRGGLRSDVGASRLQLLVMFGGFAVVLPFGLAAVHGWHGLITALPASHLSLTGGQPLWTLAGWWMIALWTFVDPSFHQRVLAAKDERTARVGIAVSVLFWFVFDLMTTTAGLLARAKLPHLADPLAAYPALAQAVLPPVLKGIFIAGVAASALAACATKSLLSAISLGHDAAQRFWKLPDTKAETLTRWGLVAALALAVVMAVALPSVVALWYTLGSCVIPGLLVPLLTSYVEPLRVGPRAGLWCSLAGIGASTVAWRLGAEAPFFSGLGASLAVWAVGFAAKRSGRAAEDQKNLA